MVLALHPPRKAGNVKTGGGGRMTSGLMMLTVATATVAIAASGPRAEADPIVFSFEGQLSTPRTGALSNLSLSNAGLTVDITRPGSVFDIVDNTSSGQTDKPPSWGARSLDPFFAETSGTPFNLNFSTALSSLSVEFGDYGADFPDQLALWGFSGLNGTGTLVASVLVPYDAVTFPAFATATISSSAPFRSARLMGGTPNFPNSVFYDNLTAEVVPEPTTLVLLGTGVLVAAGSRFRHRRTRQQHGAPNTPCNDSCSATAGESGTRGAEEA
jgi:PEP-CTERM motif